MICVFRYLTETKDEKRVDTFWRCWMSFISGSTACIMPQVNPLGIMFVQCFFFKKRDRFDYTPSLSIVLCNHNRFVNTKLLKESKVCTTPLKGVHKYKNATLLVISWYCMKNLKYEKNDFLLRIKSLLLFLMSYE